MIIVREMKLEWEHPLRTFLRLFRRKNDLSGLQKQTKLKTYTETQCEVRRADNLFAQDSIMYKFKMLT